jgi:hypothetical protein
MNLNVTDPAKLMAEDIVSEADVVDELVACTNDPAKFVTLAFPNVKPERWQSQVLKEIGDQLAENARLGCFKPVQIAISSGNGVGKSTLMAWVILWTLATYEDALGVATAGSEAQLRVRLWGELARWFSQMPDYMRTQFELSATAIYSKQNNHTWRVDARAGSPLSQESFSGLHNYGKRVLVVFDEASMIAEPIWRATDGMLNDAETQTIWIVCGNPVRLDGRFRQCAAGGKFAGLWKTFQVDSREVSLTSKEAIAGKIEYYGLDSNYCRVHVRGLFPTASAMGLIPSDWVEGASLREFFVHPADAVILGCDVALGHGEDSSVIYIRQGLDGRTHPPRKFPGLDPLQFAYKIAAAANELGAQGIFVDAGGVGEGTASRLRELGLPVHPVYFGARSDYPGGITRCANKRSEMWCAMAQWLKSGAIVNDAELKAQLCGPEYSENAQGIVLERKEDMKARGLASPDIADSLALTFAAPVFSQMSELPGPGNHLVVSEWNPFSDESLQGRPLPEARRRYTAPGWSSLKPEWGNMDNPADWVTPDAPPGEWQEEEDDGWRR